MAASANTDNEILRANITALAQRHPQVLQALTDPKSAGPTVRLTVLGDERYLWESWGQSAECAQPGLSVGHNGALPKLMLFVGMHSASVISSYLKQAPDGFVLIFEPSVSLFSDLCAQQDLTALINDTRIHFVLGGDVPNYGRSLHHFLISDARHVWAAGHQGMTKAAWVDVIPNYADYGELFLKSFQDVLSENLAKDKVQSMEDAFVGFRNSQQNYKTYKKFPKIDSLAKKGRGLPAVLVGSGPSLEKSMSFLHSIAGKAIVVACDSSLQVLLKSGIKPHFVVAIERVTETQWLFEGLPQDLQAALVAPSLLHKAAFEVYPGPKYAIMRDVGFDDWFYPSEKKHWLGMGVSNLGFQVLEILGCESVYLVGMDHAYDPLTGASYTNGVASYAQQACEIEKTFQTDDNYLVCEQTGHLGQNLQTTVFWSQDLRALSHMIQQSTAQVYNVIEAAYGLPVAGTNRLDPQLAVKHLLDAYPNSVLPELSPSVADQSFLEVNTEVDKAPVILETIAQACLSALEDISQVWPGANPSLESNASIYDRLLEKMELQRLALVRGDGNFVPKVLGNILQAYILNNGYQIQLCRAQAPEPGLMRAGQLAHYKDFFSTVYAWSGRLLKFLKA